VKRIKLLLGILLLLAVAAGLYFFFFSKPKTKSGIALNPTCPDERVIKLDLEGSTYSSTNVVEVKGSIDEPLAVKTFEYDLVYFNGALDMINEFDIYDNQGIYQPKEERRSGWIRGYLTSEPPYSFSVKPVFPNQFSDKRNLGIYFRLTCEDGTQAKLTRMTIDRHLSGYRLFAVTTNNPLKSKYFTRDE
jgi:hypothetical protein